MNSNFKQSELTLYLQFTREEWCNFRRDTPLTLTEDDLDKLHGHTEIVSLKEIEEIYLPLSRLLSFYVTARRALHRATGQFLGKPEPRVPYIIGVAGSVAVGKSTTSRVLKALLSRWPDHPNVEIITTDGFLYSNAKLEHKGLMGRKGFPESYDMPHLLRILNAIKSGKRKVPIPIYSHHYYDVILNEYEIIDQPDIVILEGLNILQTFTKKTDHSSKLFVSDFFDFSLFVDAEFEIIKKWYVDRVLSFWRGSFRVPDSYFHYLISLSESEVIQFAKKIWREINEVNLLKNILPFKNRAQLILEKSADHSVQRVYLRKI
ncbi:type I pantothenate kinase [Candidatus Coxiella mudrowiae]|uniref:Pantothenate kinase n=1 Tax=Candidatus Coxiella mudrowiae TaxID=2054173 RepID=A0ABM5UVI7_9COXI|nr:type I pantothenate kinase [Candidatus Coxiella mudrowiae]AKQ33936.1 Pantothenate kinase [Candidatus Coxiella mudrowiae]